MSEYTTVVTAYARGASGPGWSNSPVWVVLRDPDGTLREECIQPEDQTDAMRTLYRIAADVNHRMTSDAARILRRQA
jgi:hypothetical protein